jgi:hypothetical protein
MVIFVSLVPKRWRVSNKFYKIRFTQCNNLRILCQLQQVPGQTVDSKQPHFVGSDSRQLLGDNMPLGLATV